MVMFSAPQTFLNAFTSLVSRLDWTCPELPIKDVTRRIYTDTRFAHGTKPPCRGCFDASLSRTGRNTDFCKYHICICSRGHSYLAVGLYDAGGKVLDNVRRALLTNPKPFRKIVNEAELTKYLGGERSVLGARNKLKSKLNM